MVIRRTAPDLPAAARLLAQREKILLDPCKRDIVGKPNPPAAAVHDRMPVILDPEDYDHWPGPRTSVEQLKALLKPYPADAGARVADIGAKLSISVEKSTIRSALQSVG